MGQHIYNTLTRHKEPLETLQPGVVMMYVCGPTVYDKAHVGHGMSTIVYDILRRYLEFRGYEVRHVMNYTDVDDKVIQLARDTAKKLDVEVDFQICEINDFNEQCHTVLQNPPFGAQKKHVAEPTDQDSRAGTPAQVSANGG